MEDEKVIPTDDNLKPKPENDELASFFDIDGEREAFEPEKDIEMAMEAGKSSSERTREIGERLEDEQNELVIRGRKIGRAMVEADAVETEDLEGLFTDDGVVGNIQSAKTVKDKLVYLTSVRDDLLGIDGKKSITKQLNLEQQTATEGRRRQKGQEALVALQAALLEAGVVKLGNGSLAGGIESLKQAKPSWIKAPEWFNKPLAQAVEAVDLENEESRQILSEQVAKDYTWLGLDPNTRTIIEKGEEGSGPGGAIEKMYAKALEAKKIEDKLESDRRVEEEKQKYEKAMTEGVLGELRKAMELAREKTQKKGMDRYEQHEEQVGFAEYNMGEQRLADWRKAGVKMDELFNMGYGGNAKGVGGRVEVLSRAWLNEEIRNKLVDYATKNMYSDYGSRSRESYENAGEKEKWRQLWEIQK